MKEKYTNVSLTKEVAEKLRKASKEKGMYLYAFVDWLMEQQKNEHQKGE